MKKVSGNFEDKNRIAEWHKTGATPEQISDRVLVRVEYVKAYIDSLTPKASPQQRAADTRKAKKEAALEQEETAG
jgi:hypothetical protein